jgi:hypothetical protein
MSGDFPNFQDVEPTLIEDIEYVRQVHQFKHVKKQFLESTGKFEITEPSGLVISKAIISGYQRFKDVTKTFIMMTHGRFQENLTPIQKITVDTGLLNEYTGMDIEQGARKLIQIEYVTDDKNYEEKKVRRTEIDDGFFKRTPFRRTDDAGNEIQKPDFELTNLSILHYINRERTSGNELVQKVPKDSDMFPGGNI